jgi:class 3 adenylate cyclase
MSPAQASSADPGERRQVTVMFVELVGSTTLSARLDPEDLRELLAAYHKLVFDAVQPHEGHVAQYLGDGALVYFGYPISHEDDGERAIRAGLSLLERTRGPTLQDTEIAIEAVEKTLEEVDSSEEKIYLSDLRRLHGDFLIRYRAAHPRGR